MKTNKMETPRNVYRSSRSTSLLSPYIGWIIQYYGMRLTSCLSLVVCRQATGHQSSFQLPETWHTSQICHAKKSHYLHSRLASWATLQVTFKEGFLRGLGLQNGQAPVFPSHYQLESAGTETGQTSVKDTFCILKPCGVIKTFYWHHLENLSFHQHLIILQ